MAKTKKTVTVSGSLYAKNSSGVFEKSIPAIIWVNKQYDNVRKAQKDWDQAGDFAEDAKKRLPAGTVCDAVVEVDFRVEGGSPLQGGEHSRLTAEFSVPSTGGFDAVSDCILRAFKN